MARRFFKNVGIKFILFLGLFLCQPGFAQLSIKGELELAVDHTTTSRNETLNSAFGFSLRSHLEADYVLDPVRFRFVFDPGLRLTDTLETSLIEPGLTEAFVLWRNDLLDLSAGLERLPLEYARLSIPYRLEALGKTGQALGLLGARANFYLENWRIRPAFIYRIQDEQAGAALSVRHDFTAFELEAHAVYLERFATGLGGSGLIGDIVIYGEAWLLTGPLEARAALGLSGFWDDALWTIEGAYAGHPLLPNEKAFPQILGQLNLPQGDASTLDIMLGLGLADSILKPGSSTVQGLANAVYSFSDTDYQTAIRIGMVYSELATLYSLRLSLTGFF